MKDEMSMIANPKCRASAQAMITRRVCRNNCKYWNYYGKTYNTGRKKGLTKKSCKFDYK